MGVEMEKLNVRDMYRMPWSKNDHPNGWIEITSYCNMSCPGCYRGCDRKNLIKAHKPLSEIKKDVLLFRDIRNCQMISLSGGEPLLHPDLIEIVKFIKKNGMNVNVFTNGKLLSKNLLIKLKSVGLTSLVVGVGALKDPNGKKSEKELNLLRQKYADIVNGVGGITLAFISSVDERNLREFNDIIDWFHKNSDNTETIIAILQRPMILSKKDLSTKNQISYMDLVKEIWGRYPDLKYAAYLGSQAENLDFKWLWSFQIMRKNKLIGYSTRKLPEFVQMMYHFRKNKYFCFLDKKNYSFNFFTIFLLLFFSGEIKLIKELFKGILKNPFVLLERYYTQQIIILSPPGFVDGKRDICDSCPDAMFYNGKLIPSCALEEFKKFGKPYELGQKF